MREAKRKQQELDLLMLDDSRLHELAALGDASPSPPEFSNFGGASGPAMLDGHAPSFDCLFGTCTPEKDLKAWWQVCHRSQAWTRL